MQEGEKTNGLFRLSEGRLEKGAEFPVLRRVLQRLAQLPGRLIGAFVLSGALAGVAGVVFAARYGSVSSGAGTGIELEVVTNGPVPIHGIRIMLAHSAPKIAPPVFAA